MTDIEARRNRLERELERARRHPEGMVREWIVAALMDRLKALERINGDTERATRGDRNE